LVARAKTGEPRHIAVERLGHWPAVALSIWNLPPA